MYAFFVVISLYVIVVRFCTCVAFPATAPPTPPTNLYHPATISTRRFNKQENHMYSLVSASAR